MTEEELGDYAGLDRSRKTSYCRLRQAAAILFALVLVGLVHVPSNPAGARSLMSIDAPVSKFLGDSKRIDIFKFPPDKYLICPITGILELLSGNLDSGLHVKFGAGPHDRLSSWRPNIIPGYGIGRVNSDLCPTPHVIGGSLSKILNANNGEYCSIVIGDGHLGTLHKNVSSQLSLGGLARVSQSQNSGNPKPDSRCGQHGRKASKPSCEIGDRIAANVLPKGYIGFTFAIFGITFVLTLSGIIGATWYLGRP